MQRRSAASPRMTFGSSLPDLGIVLFIYIDFNPNPKLRPETLKGARFQCWDSFLRVAAMHATPCASRHLLNHLLHDVLAANWRCGLPFCAIRRP